jgi:predicted metal-dependent phosphoesterase TrpH
MGKQSEHYRALKELVLLIESLDLRIELLEQELSQKSNSRLSRLQEIKEKLDVVQACKYYFY